MTESKDLFSERTSRRQFLSTSTAIASGTLGAEALLQACGNPTTASGTSELPLLFPGAIPANAIYYENQKPGTIAWSIEHSHITPNFSDTTHIINTNSAMINKWDNTLIKGYADKTSVNRGESIGLYVSTSQKSYNIEVYRMGWYGGKGARLMLTVQNLPGQDQPIPQPEADTGLIAANWTRSYTLQTGTNWVSGAYLAKLIASDESMNYIFFVLRDDTAKADILYEIGINTYQAYNDWGGKSLYDSNSQGGRAHKVSFDRPYAGYNGAGFFFTCDYNMIRWLESRGYSVSYATDLDTQERAGLLNNRKVFLTTYHDEYWSAEMINNITAALQRGKHLAFFAANNIFWQIRYEPSASGQANRIITCYKHADLDPMSLSNPALTTVEWRDTPVNLPENALMGVMSEGVFNFGTAFPWVVVNADHWFYEHTGLKNGDSIPGVVGYEYDKVWNNGATPKNLTVLSNSPVVTNENIFSHANGSIYIAPSGGMVFAAGTMYWSWKLDDNNYQFHGADPRIQQMTTNILNKMIGTAK